MKQPRLSRDFNLLWTSETVSNFGDRVTLFVIPTLMVFLLGATPFQIGLISTAQYVAIPVFSLVAGGLVDRWPLRRLLVACDLIRFVAVGIIPVAYWLGFLSVPLLFICVAAMSVATVFFNIGYLPAASSIVPQADLVRANTRLEGSRTTSEVAGPGLAGLLYQAMGATSLLFDAASYLVSAIAFRAMHPFDTPPGKREPLRERLALGIRLNWTDPILRRSTAGTLLANIGGPIFVTQMPVLAYQGLHMSAGELGTVMTIAALGSVAGTLVATWVNSRIGTGRMVGLAMVCHSASGLGLLAVPRFSGSIVLCATLMSYGFFFAWYNINSQSLRQKRAPIKDQAVIHGAYRTITWGVIPISTFVGGWIVTMLAGHMSILNASKITMVVATVIGISSIIPLGRMQHLLDTMPPMHETHPAAATELTGPTEFADPKGREPTAAAASAEPAVLAEPTVLTEPVALAEPAMAESAETL